jgi:hypothetical protein
MIWRDFVHARLHRSRLRRHALDLKLSTLLSPVRLYRMHTIVAEYVIDLRQNPRCNCQGMWHRAGSCRAHAAGARRRCRHGDWFICHFRWMADGVHHIATAMAAAFVCVYRTTETVTLSRPRPGKLHFTGGLGAFRAINPSRGNGCAYQLAVAARQLASTNTCATDARA